MDRRKIKNFLILLLALINLLFLAFLVAEQMEARQAQRQAQDALLSALSQQGVLINPGIIPPGSPQEAAFLSRDAKEGEAFFGPFTLDGLMVICPDLNSGAKTTELSTSVVWEQMQRYTIESQVDVITALVSLGAYLENPPGGVRFERVEMGYALLDSPALIEFRPAWIVTTDMGLFLIDRQNGEIRAV